MLCLLSYNFNHVNAQRLIERKSYLNTSNVIGEFSKEMSKVLGSLILEIRAVKEDETLVNTVLLK